MKKSSRIDKVFTSSESPSEQYWLIGNEIDVVLKKVISPRVPAKMIWKIQSIYEFFHDLYTRFLHVILFTFSHHFKQNI